MITSSDLVALVYGTNIVVVAINVIVQTCSCLGVAFIIGANIVIIATILSATTVGDADVVASSLFVAHISRAGVKVVA